MIREERMRVELPAVIALGSNLGDREKALRDAVRAINALPGVVVSAASEIVESPALKPDGVDESAPSYLNAVIGVRSAISPEQLLDGLNEIEQRLGRVRTERWGDRTIDLDIITAAGPHKNNDRLTLPHPRAWQRGFVLVPWAQLNPAAQLPGHGPVAGLAAATTDVVLPYPAPPLMSALRSGGASGSA
ncbi:MAG: 2-amino-4-hydroxy-6-hydroxymethyldihydropteridine diphosphokinase, partial [Microbacteriaceae bacterium]|nr:2-amino-4-hydroxy-6-hydroxymethyldihydropteridine diphosphokinase [Microbacteriaceae bacterium]